MNSTFPARAIAEGVWVAPQLTPEAMAEAARAGFRSVINNRPDFEGGPEQPTNAAIEAAARAAGLEYRFLPVASNYQSPEEAAAVRDCWRSFRVPCSCSAAPAPARPGSISWRKRPDGRPLGTFPRSGGAARTLVFGRGAERAGSKGLTGRFVETVDWVSES